MNQIGMQSSAAATSRLDGHHRATIAKVFNHPTSHNVQWHDALSLLKAVGAKVTVGETRLIVTIGSHTEGFDRPKGHALDEQQLIDMRQMLIDADVTRDHSKQSRGR